MLKQGTVGVFIVMKSLFNIGHTYIHSWYTQK